MGQHEMMRFNYRRTVVPGRNALKRIREWCKIKNLVVLTVASVVLFFGFNAYSNDQSSIVSMSSVVKKKADDNHGIRFNGERLVHFDLKGAPPKISYILKLLPLLKQLGATGILMEYEDTFPYHSGLEVTVAGNAYTLSDVAAIVKTAELNSLSVIPLIPTFGHIEFVLKHERFRKFREVEENPQSLCPMHEEVFYILMKMINQVLAVHNTSKYLHIGCDEVQFLGKCPRCQAVIRRQKWQKNDIYFGHIRRIAEYIMYTYPGVKPIVWGDKFVKANERVILKHGMPKLVDVMLWQYDTHERNFPTFRDLQSFANHFEYIWIANAFKGAEGFTDMITNIACRLETTNQWMKIVENWKNKLNFKGIAVTGWQRFNHFLPLCELLPVGIPSLALNLQMLRNRNGIDPQLIKQTLKCNDMIPINLTDIIDFKLQSHLKCDFPGSKVYHKIHLFYAKLRYLKRALAQIHNGVVTFYNIVHNSTDPLFVHRVSRINYKKLLRELDGMENEIKVALDEVYDQYTISEWIMTYVTPVRLRLEAAINIISAIGSRRTWPRRPFEKNDLLMKKIFNNICGNNETRGCTFFDMYNW